MANPKGNPQNLINLSQRTKKEQLAIQKKGAKAAGKKHREKKQLKEELEILLKTDEGQLKICQALLSRAKRGDVRAFEVIRDTIGQKPVDKIDIDQDSTFEVTIKVVE
jgi:hypothetical protein